MSTMLIDNKNGTIDLVSEIKVNIGEKVLVGVNKGGQSIMKKIENIIEQRKEKGTYKNEKDRRYWARISL